MPWHGSRMLRNDCIKNLVLLEKKSQDRLQQRRQPVHQPDQAQSRVVLTGIVAAILADGLLFGFGVATVDMLEACSSRSFGFALLLCGPALFAAALCRIAISKLHEQDD